MALHYGLVFQGPAWLRQAAIAATIPIKRQSNRSLAIAGACPAALQSVGSTISHDNQRLKNGAKTDLRLADNPADGCAACRAFALDHLHPVLGDPFMRVGHLNLCLTFHASSACH
jgi:hypothetical protein